VLTLLCAAGALQAGDLMEVSPITDKILMLHLRDGHLDDRPGFGNSGPKTLYHRATVIADAETLGNYTLSSSTDSNYSTARNPSYIGRKSKCYDWYDAYPAAGLPKSIQSHYLYLELPTAMVQGGSYTLGLAEGLVDNGTSRSFVYNVNTMVSETIHVNLVGFAATGVKRAFLSHWMGGFNNGIHTAGGLNLDSIAGRQFRLINYATKATAFTGTVPTTMRWGKAAVEHYNMSSYPERNYTHADVWELNFDSFNTPGEYVVAVDGIGCSQPFEIGNDVVREPFYYAMKGLFTQRLGIVKDIEDGLVMPRDHHPDDIIWRYDPNIVSGYSARGFNTAAPQVFRNTAFPGGHYHDAGDWDQYTSHWKVPMTLMLLFDLAPTKFYDGEIGNRYKLNAADPTWIDEGTNGIPDLLDEAAWLLKFHRYARQRLIIERGTTGGVPGYVGRDNCSGAAAWNDKRDWYVTGENPTATYYYAASAAWYAMCLGRGHAQFAMWRDEAQAAWNWAFAAAPTAGTARGVAAAAMYRLTGTTSYQDTFKSIYSSAPDDYTGRADWLGNNELSLAMALYAMLPASHPGLDMAFQTTVRSKIKANSDGLQARGTGSGSNSTGMRLAHTNPYAPFRNGLLTTPKAMFHAVQHKLSGTARYLDCVRHMTSYTLGGNQLNMSYLSGLGERSNRHVFHPNSWALLDPNSRVLQTENLIGYTSYFGAYADFFSSYSNANEWVTRTVSAFPVITGGPHETPNNWPEGEEFFANRGSIAGSEFTIHEQQRMNIFNYGYLKAVVDTSTTRYVPNARPTVSINLVDQQNLPSSGFMLTANASSDTRSVKYYRDWHFIGESFDAANDFAFPHVPWSTGSDYIYAVAIDNKGRLSSNSTANRQFVNIVPVPSAPSGLAATANSATQITLTWNDRSSIETAYEIQRKTGAAGTYALIHTAAANATSYVDQTVVGGTRYFYRVRAMNGTVGSSYSNEASATTPLPYTTVLNIDFDANKPASITNRGSGTPRTSGASVYAGDNTASGYLTFDTTRVTGFSQSAVAFGRAGGVNTKTLGLTTNPADYTVLIKLLASGYTSAATIDVRIRFYDNSNYVGQMRKQISTSDLAGPNVWTSLTLTGFTMESSGIHQLTATKLAGLNGGTGDHIRVEIQTSGFDASPWGQDNNNTLRVDDIRVLVP
jgi:hypothetical protein